MARAIGALCGSGNLLFEPQKMGVRVMGNIELRPYFHTANWVWNANFKGPILRDREAEVSAKWYDADLALGHPPCGSFSTLGQTSTSKDRFTEEERRAWNSARNAKAGMLPDFCFIINRFKPRIFAMDNLPKMYDAFPESWWKEQLPHYRLTFVNMWNWDFGNPQKRRRAWVIGTLEDRRFRFREPKKRIDGPRNAWEAISDLPWEPWRDVFELAHIHYEPENNAMGAFRFKDPPTTSGTIGETAIGYLNIPPGMLWPYCNRDGRHTRKPAHVRLARDRPARTMSKTETLRHPLTGWPLTPRERARLMGWPDDFKLIVEGIEPSAKNLRKLSMITGKAVPNDFVRYLVPQLLDHVNAS